MTQTKTLLNGYQEASEKTGVPVFQLVRMVERRQIRVYKPNKRSVKFYLEELLEDIQDMLIPKIG